MLKLDPKWGETPELLLQRSMQAESKRLRERFMALSLVVLGHSPRQVAKHLGRRPQPVCEWIHRFNQNGPDGLIPNFQSPSVPRLTPEEVEKLRQALEKPPRQSGLKVGRWSSKRVASYLKKTFGKTAHPDTARRYIRRLGFRLKLPRKKFVKAKEKLQKAFAQDLETLERSRWIHSVTAWSDEGHLYQDALLRRMWCPRGKEALVDSTSPGKKKVSFYVAVIRPLGKIIPLQVDTFNAENTARFLEKLRAKLPGYRIDALGDRATHHKGEAVAKALAKTHIHRHLLPAHSPKMNAAEQWIRWAKEDLSYNICWEDLKALVRAFHGFVVSMAHRSAEVLQRCVPELFGFSCV